MYFTNNGIDLYQGDMVVGDREATAQEVETYLLEKEKEFNNQSILSKIADLEAQQARPLRELLIDNSNEYAKTKLETINAQIEVLRGQL